MSLSVGIFLHQTGKPASKSSTIPELASAGFFRPQVVAEDEHIVPAVAVLAKGPDRLQRHGQRIGQDVLLALLAVIDQFILAFLRREPGYAPIRARAPRPVAADG
jgi:hypothetical protein